MNYTWYFNYTPTHPGPTATGITDACSNPCEFSARFDYATAGGAGTYTVGLDIVDASGVDSGIYTQGLAVVENKQISQLSAQFSPAVVSGANVTTSVTVTGGQPPVYVWVDYGDGVTVKIPTPTNGAYVHTHPYLRSGVYNISAIVADNANHQIEVGLGAPVTVNVPVTQPPPPPECTGSDCNVVPNYIAPSGEGAIIYYIVEGALGAIGAFFVWRPMKPKFVFRVFGIALIVIAFLALLGIIHLSAIIPPVF